MKRILSFLISVAMIMPAAPARAAFDPVNDDTDLFRNNPNIPSERPNVLIILDNTANWNTAFTNEKSALVSVVNALDDSYNVGLMMFPETGSPNDSIDGGYVRYGMRQMTSTNKTALATMVGNLDITADKGNNATTGLAMWEAYLYFGGKASRASYGKIKTDFAGNTAYNPLAANLPGNALPASPTASSLYNPAISNGCQKNYIIYISNGPANENATARATHEALLTGARGSAPSIITINPNGQQPDWADEQAQFMAGNDVNSTLSGTQTVTTYTVEVDPGTTGQGPAMTALLQSMAVNGNGKYFAVTSGGSGQAIISALQSIFSEIQAVNSVFAASTLPVSVNVRGTNLNQLYIGVFRPDANDLPRWFGNVKAYKLAKDPSTGSVFTVDANGVPAINSTTGFITGSAVSFWTSATQVPTNYWSFRTAAQNGIGGSSDSPDGDLVEKGGAAQQVRSQYFSIGVNDATTPRPLYTCTQGPAFPVCGPGSALSATPFNSTNTDITAAALNLNTHLVSPLTAAQTQAVSTLTDRRSLSLNNTTGGVAVSSIVTNSTTASVTSLNNTNNVVSVSAMDNGATAFTLTGITVANGSNKVATATWSSSGGTPSLSINQTIIISGTTNFNGTYTVKSVTNASRQFTFGSFSGPISETAGTLTTSNTTVTVTTGTTAHNFVVGDTVTMANVTPSNFSGTKTITAVGTNTFQWQNEAVSTAPVVTGSTTATSRGLTVTATTSAAHGFVSGQSVKIAGASLSGYNGTFTIVTVPTTTSFTYLTSTTQTATPTGTITATAGGTTATVTLPGSFTLNNPIQISGADQSGYNQSITLASPCTPCSSFTYTVPAGTVSPATGTITAGGSTTNLVTASLANHGFTVGQVIRIRGVTGDTNFNNDWTVAAVTDANAFVFNTITNLGSTAGSPTVRLASNPLAYATINGHGYTGSFPVTIANAASSGYNGAFTATVVDANTISYPLSASQGGTDTSTTITASVATTTARGTSTAHGFTTGSVVTVAGAVPSAFNGTFTVTKIDNDNFSYTIPSAQLAASGAITAVSTGAGASEATNIVDWVRGMDNFQDENANSSLTDTRASIHGDVLHSRPAVVNYNRRGATDPTNADNDVYIFYGGNDGVFRAIKGGFASTTGDPAPGQEVWGLIAPEHFGNLQRLRNNSPSISSNFKKPYFFDGPIGAYTLDTNGDGKLVAADGDKVYLYLTMRRGGRFIYALDVSDPLVPKLLWRKGCPSLSSNASDIDSGTGCDKGWGELGYTFSEPRVTRISATSNPVLVFGAGYDQLVEDVTPSTITSNTASSVVAGGTTFTRSMGRGLYVVDATNGNIIWQAAGRARSGTDTSTHPYKVVSGMDYSIASDVAVVIGDPTPNPHRAYVGDTGGNVWRMDFGDTDPANWTVTKLASVADMTTASGMRKFLFPPDVIGAAGFDAVVIGSGDREHPFDTTVVNRVYMFKDKNQENGTTSYATITEGTGTGTPMLNVTTNCIQVAANCNPSVNSIEVASGGFTASQNAANALAASTNFGWWLTLAAGEKQVGGTLAAGNGAVLFGTNQPSASAGGGACSPNLGVARQYSVSFLNGSAFTGTATFTTYSGGGFLPSPVLVFVNLPTSTPTNVNTGGSPVGGTVQGNQLEVGGGSGFATDITGVVCYGASCSLAPGTQLYSRLRKFWYKELD